MLESPGTRRSQGGAAPWELRLREDFFSRYGPAFLPVPESLETSRLFLALKLSTRYMDEGFRAAAEELFSAPVFLASLSLSVLVYFAAWLAPEPLFSKAFAAALTVRLSLLVGLVELGRVAMACLRLYREAEAATASPTPDRTHHTTRPSRRNWPDVSPWDIPTCERTWHKSMRRGGVSTIQIPWMASASASQTCLRYGLTVYATTPITSLIQRIFSVS